MTVKEVKNILKQVRLGNKKLPQNLCSAIDLLSGWYGTVVREYYINGKSIRKISKELCYSITWVEKKKYKGLLKLTKTL